jgi:outer membrane protein OmpA-like peptidoglycan-associated protein
MVEMARRKRAEGAPAYIQLFTTMMILLLAFFIIITTLSEKQEAGFRDGIGDVRDAFGIRGGPGVLPYHFSESGIQTGPASRITARGAKDMGMSRELMRGSGGVGISDLNYRLEEPKFLRIQVKERFEPGSAAIAPDLAVFLDLAGMVLASQTPYHFAIRQITGETGNTETDCQLAQQRAAAVARFLHRSCSLPLDRITAVGYSRAEESARDILLASSDQRQLLVVDLYKTGPDNAPMDRTSTPSVAQEHR